jgi:peptide/nickel transport system substrate-binding protein
MARFVLALAASVCLLAGGAASQTLRIGLQEDPDTLDGAKNWSFVGRIVMQALCDKLVDIAPDQSIVPMLAAGWQTAEDGQSITFKLRTDARFHDGERVDAAAVKFSLDRALTLPDSRRRSEISAVSNVIAVDDFTVRVEMKMPFSPLLAQFADRAGIIVSPKAVAAAGDQFGSKPVCAGPYRFVERVVQDRIVLEKFAGYYEAARYHIQRLVFLPIPDTTVRFANLQAGQLDMIERMAANDLEGLRKNKNLATASATGMGYTGLTINVANGDRGASPFSRDKRLRQALDAAIDRNAINQVVYAGEYTVGNQPVPPANFYFNPAIPVPGRDLARAKALVKESGIANPGMTLLVPNTTESRQAAELIQSMARDAGIDLKLQAVEFVTMLSLARDGKFDGDFVGWSGRIDADANIHTLLACKVPGNDGHYCNPEVDRLLDAARATADRAQRKKHYEQVMRILDDEKPIIYLWHAKWIWGFSTRLEGFTPYPDALIRLRDVKLKS